LANNAIRNAHKLFKHKPSAVAVCEIQDKTKFKTPLVTTNHEVFSSDKKHEKKYSQSTFRPQRYTYSLVTPHSG
jgi:hypothetical protein